VQLRWISATGVSEHPVDAAAVLLTRPDGLVWLDVPTWDEAADRVLRDVFAFHPLAIGDCARRNQVPKVHTYPVTYSWSCPHPRPALQVTFTPSSWTSSSATGTW
jgi:Mg2+ and Co2+ transporter CorA